MSHKRGPLFRIFFFIFRKVLKNGAELYTTRKGYQGKHEKASVKQIFANGWSMPAARCETALVKEYKTTGDFYFQRVREIIAHQLKQDFLEDFDGKIEMAELGITQEGKHGR